MFLAANPLAHTPGSVRTKRADWCAPSLVGALLLCSAACIASTWWLQQTRLGLDRAVARTERQAKAVMEAGEKAVQARSVRAMVRESAELALLPHQWERRRINLRRASVSREDFNQLLRDVAWQSASVSAMTEFDISVNKSTDGLFLATSAREPLTVTLQGSVLFRATRAPSP